MNEERIRELFSNEAYVKGLFELGNYEAASAKLAEDGVVVSSDELKKVVDIVKKKQTGEISDEQLEEVAGGLDPFTGMGIWAGIIITGSITTIVCKTC